MATKTFKIGLSATDKTNMAQDIREQIEEMLFDAYSSSSTYEVGDYVVYNDTLYRCTTAVESAESFDSTKWTQATLQDLVDDVNGAVASVNNKANVDGYYETLTSGSALQLISTTYEEDETPYTFRTAGGSKDIGTRVLENKIVGGTINFNQLVQNNASSQTLNDVVITKNDNGSYTFNGLASANIRLTICSLALVNGHKYLLFGVPSGASVTTGGYRLFIDNLGNQVANTIVNNAYTGNVELKVSIDSGANVNFTIFIQLFDLTAMFGSEFADHLYTLESNTSGSGVALFKQYFQLPYYAYNSGTMLSTKAVSKKNVGFNAFDYSNGTAQLVGGNQYQITGPYTSVPYQDINGNSETLTIDDDGLFTPTNNGTLTITGGDDSSTCVHLVWSGYRNGEYEPYKAYEYDLGSDVLRGIIKLDSDNNPYFYGDYKVPDGTITRIMGKVDMGSLSWSYNSDGSFFYCEVSGIKTGSHLNIICPKYATGSRTDDYTSVDKSIVFYNGYLRVRDTSYTDAITFKTSLSGVYLVYELETPTTEQGTAYTELQNVDDFGTEQANVIGYNESTNADSTIYLPYGRDSSYYANLRDKLQRLPDMPENEGVYVVQYSSRQCTFYSLPTWLSANGYGDITGFKETIGGTLRQLLVSNVVAGGGTLDFLNTAYVDLSTLTWTKAGSAFYAVLSDKKAGANTMLCSKYKYSQNGGFLTENLCIGDSVNSSYLQYIFIRDDNYADATAFKNAMKGILVAYEKA